jgi:Ca-activated chloride channel family protein
MNIDVTLDYQTILRNEGRPVHLVAKLTASKLETPNRPWPVAIAIVLDRSGSMTGKPLEFAKQASAGIVRNLRPDDSFSVIVFDDAAQVVIPLQKPVDRQGIIESIAQISAGSSTNLMAGWLLGRDELLKAGQDCDKKILLLTDGHLNQGIIEPENVEALTRSGLSKDAIRTSCLGFGDDYNEVVLAAMSSVGNGQLHDADSPEKFPIILADELDGLQKITAQNVRLRVEPKIFCHSWMQFSDYPVIKLPDGRVEIAVGDLISEEDRYFVLLTEVLPLPLLPDGTLPASLEGEELLGLEFVWTEIDDTEIKGCTSTHLVRIRGTQSADDVVLNEEVIAVIANQIAGKAMRDAADQARKGDFDEGLRSINLACATIQGFAASELTAEANDLLDESLRTIGSRKVSCRNLKDLVYESRYYARTSSHTLYTGSRKKSKLGRKPSAQEQYQQSEQ